MSCASCPRRRGTGPFLREMLNQLVCSASQAGLAAAAAFMVPQFEECSPVDFKKFFQLLPRDRLTFVLMDEAQYSYLLEREKKGAVGQYELDAGNVLDMRQ